jgi:hypothetical protein
MSQDPVMATFPLALSVEPRLLPFAINNGFKMDKKVLFSLSNLGFVLIVCAVS